MKFQTHSFTFCCIGSILISLYTHWLLSWLGIFTKPSHLCFYKFMVGLWLYFFLLQKFFFSKLTITLEKHVYYHLISCFFASLRESIVTLWSFFTTSPYTYPLNIRLSWLFFRMWFLSDVERFRMKERISIVEFIID